jgi:hypothetical protein
LWLGAPLREWLAVLFLPVAGGVVLAALVVEIVRADPPRTALWFAFAFGLGGGLTAGLAYTLRLALRRRLFIRDEAAVVASRARITTIGIPLGIAITLGVALVSGAAQIAVLAALIGAGLGLEPGLVANFLRLRREEWLPNGQG